MRLADLFPALCWLYMTAESQRLLVCVTCYNEDSIELQRTLIGLHEQYLHMPDTYMNVILIQDGWGSAHPSFKDYVYKLYGQDSKAKVSADPERNAPQFSAPEQTVCFLVRCSGIRLRQLCSTLHQL